MSEKSEAFDVICNGAVAVVEAVGEQIPEAQVIVEVVGPILHTGCEIVAAVIDYLDDEAEKSSTETKESVPIN